MTNNDRFDAALRAHAFHRSFEGDHPGEAQPDSTAAEAPSPDFAAELEASLMRDLNVLTAGLRPKKLLPDPTFDAASTAGSPGEVKPRSERAPLLPPATWPAQPEPAKVSPYAPPPKLPAATWPAAATPTGGIADSAGERPPSPYAPQAKRPLPDASPASPPPGAPETSAGPHPAVTAPEPKQISRYAPPRRPAYPGQANRVAARRAAPREEPAPEEDSAKPALVLGEGWREANEGNKIGTAPHAEMFAEQEVGVTVAATPHDAAELEGEAFAGPSADELAKLYAPRLPAASGVAPKAESLADPHGTGKGASASARRVRKRVTAAPGSVDTSLPEPLSRPGRTALASAHTADGVRSRPIQWHASDEAPPGSPLPALSGANWTSKAAAVIVLVGLIGGAGAVVTLESLTAPVPAPGLAGAEHVKAAAPGTSLPADGTPPKRNLTVAARVPARGVEVIHADDAANGLAPADGAPLPSSAKAFPLPQSVAPGVGLRATTDPARAAGDSSPDAGREAPVPPADAAPGAAAGGLGQAAADSADLSNGAASSAVPPPRAPTARPDRGGATPEGVLAYAPATDPVDHGAKAFASKSDSKSAAKTVPPGSARVVSWVNMRATADNKAATVKVLPAGSVVTVVQCGYWCEVVADGKRGFVYKNFLKTTGSTASTR